MTHILKVSNMVEGLEQELADITDSGDFAAYQVSILWSLISIFIPDNPEDFVNFSGIPFKLLRHPAPPPPLPTHHCKEEPHTVSLLQVSF